MFDFNLKKVLIVIAFVWFLWNLFLPLLNIGLRVLFSLTLA